jgi:hypothetical protein
MIEDSIKNLDRRRRPPCLPPTGTVTWISDLPAGVPDVAEREFLDEALICYRNGAFRAAASAPLIGLLPGLKSGDHYT